MDFLEEDVLLGPLHPPSGVSPCKSHLTRVGKGDLRNWRSFSVSASLWDIEWDFFLSEVNSRWLTEAAVDSRVEDCSLKKDCALWIFQSKSFSLRARCHVQGEEVGRRGENMSCSGIVLDPSKRTKWLQQEMEVRLTVFQRMWRRAE